ncbi:PHP domain-containing protein [Mycoplasmatota bacterium WC44]
MKINLHMHSTYSDGRKDAGEIIDLLLQEEVELFSITDHDAIDGINECIHLCNNKEITYIPGIEITSQVDTLSEDLRDIDQVHILGYGFNVEKMKNGLEKFSRYKLELSKKLIDKLIENGLDLSDSDFLDIKNLTKGSIARVIVLKGYAVSRNEAFEKYINKYPEFKTKCLDVKYILSLIKKTGGISVLAHPFDAINNSNKVTLSTDEVRVLVKSLKKYGLDGLEIYYKDYSKQQIEFLERLSFEFNLLSSAGTDYHFKQHNEKLFKDIDESSVTILKRINF